MTEERPNFEARPHWFRASFPRGRVSRACKLLRNYFPGEPEYKSKGYYEYDRGFQISGVQAYVFYDKEDESNDVRADRIHQSRDLIEVRGSALDLLEGPAVFDLYFEMQALECLGRRLDNAVDDHYRSVEVSTVRNAWRKGNVSGYKRVKPDGAEWETSDGYPIKIGDSIRFGKGDKQKIVYCKKSESDGEYPGVRWEDKRFGEHADIVFQDLLQSKTVDAFYDKVAAWAMATIDFRDRSKIDSRGNWSRCPQLRWWRKLRKNFQQANVRSTTKPFCIDRWTRWHSNAAARGLALYAERNGMEATFDYLLSVIRAGQDRLTDRERNAVKRSLEDRRKFVLEMQAAQYAHDTSQATRELEASHYDEVAEFFYHQGKEDLAI